MKCENEFCGIRTLSGECRSYDNRPDFIRRCSARQKYLNSHHWISVSERLPEDGNQTVLALMDVDNKPVLANYYGEPYYSWHEITDGVNLEKRVTHWRELPPPPEGE